jgi:preprotein translocase subunit SecA
MHVQVVRNDAPQQIVKNVQESKSEASPVPGDLPAAPSAAPTSKPKTIVNDAFSKTPRNAPCPCGSGKKFKMCHGAA